MPPPEQKSFPNASDTGQKVMDQLLHSVKRELAYRLSKDRGSPRRRCSQSTVRQLQMLRTEPVGESLPFILQSPTKTQF